MPVVGNVKLIILSERMIRDTRMSSSPDAQCEKLIVRWKTCGKSKAEENSGIRGQSTSAFDQAKNQRQEDFVGLFIFEFDEEGRIMAHTIEHVQEGGNWEKTTRVISVTDWLLGRAWGKKDEETPGLALEFCPSHRSGSAQRRVR
jgi:hypothetical protein